MILNHVIAPGEIHLKPYTQRFGFGHLTFLSAHRPRTATQNLIDQLPKWLYRIEKMHLKAPPKRFHTVGGSPKVQQPGFGLMAMGKSLYEEGYPIFYGQNTFHLGPRPIPITSQYFLFPLPARQAPQHDKENCPHIHRSRSHARRFSVGRKRTSISNLDEETRVKIHV